MQNPQAHFSQAVLAWYDTHGRKDLPWQQQPDPYRVWVSEIMLQQTQVNSVIPYYQRFMQRFPDIATLAGAELDTVLEYWAGLGYYARARNLHKTARRIQHHYAGQFPGEFAEVAELPGIGRSTAGAVLALARGQRYPILDGNVKRVLARYFAVEGWPGEIGVTRQLWQHAEALLPQIRIRDYTQAMMDLGAIVCTRSRPHCTACPVQQNCLAQQQNRTTELPATKPHKVLPVRKIQMLILHNATGEYLLQRRPPVGIWGGLLSFPEIAVEEDCLQWAHLNIGEIRIVERWDWFRHTFSHYHLEIRPVRAQLVKWQFAVREADSWVWYNARQPQGGLAAPAKKLIDRMLEHKEDLLNESNGSLRKTGD